MIPNPSLSTGNLSGARPEPDSVANPAIDSRYDDLPAIFAAADPALLVLDRELCVRRYTLRAATLLSPAVPACGQPVDHLSPIWDASLLEADARRVLDDRVPIERDVGGEDGRWLQATLHPYCTSDGQVGGVIITLADISATRETQRALAESERRLQQALAAETICVWTWEVATASLWTSDSAAHLFGGRPPRDLVDLLSGAQGDERARRRAEIEHALAQSPGAFHTAFQRRNPDGTLRWYETRAHAETDENGALTRIMGMTADVTQRKEIERTLRQTEERLTLALEAGRMVAWTWDSLTNRLWLNESAQQALVDLQIESFEDVQALVHPADWPSLAEALQEAILERTHFRSRQRMIRPSDGAVFWTEIRGAVQKDEGERVTGLVGIVVDLTEKLKAEDALRVSRERLRTILGATTGFALILLDEEGRIAEWGPCAVQLFGYTEEEALERDGAFLFVPEDREQGALAELEEARRLGVASSDRWFLCKDGTRFRARTSLASVQESRITGFVRMIRNARAGDDDPAYGSQAMPGTGRPARGTSSAVLH